MLSYLSLFCSFLFAIYIRLKSKFCTTYHSIGLKVDTQSHLPNTQYSLAIEINFVGWKKLQDKEVLLTNPWWFSWSYLKNFITVVFICKPGQIWDDYGRHHNHKPQIDCMQIFYCCRYHLKCYLIVSNIIDGKKCQQILNFSNGQKAIDKQAYALLLPAVKFDGIG